MPDIEKCRDFAEMCGQDLNDINEANRRLKAASRLLNRFMDDRQSALIVAISEATTENARQISALTGQVAILTEQVGRLTEALTTKPKTKKDKPAKSSVPKKKYGEFGNVLLTDAQYASLVKKFGESTTLAYIEDVDAWCQQQGKTYSDYAAAIRNFYKRDEKAGKLKQPSEASEHSYDVDKILQHSLTTAPKL